MAQMGSGGPGGPRRPGPGGGKTGFGGGPPRNRRGPPAKDPAKLEAERKAQELARRSGIPIERARRIVGGHEKLTEVLEELAFRAQVDVLMAQHGLNRALATQIQLGQASLEQVLDRRRADEEIARSKERSILDESVGKELTLGLHGHRTVRGRIVAVHKYEVEVELAEGGGRELVHKLQVKFAYLPDDYKKVRRGMDHDEARRAREVAPLPRPQDRYPCSDRRLGVAWAHKSTVALTTLEGERFTGELAWIARYEIGVRVKGEAQVVVFRHALDNFEERGK